jgi:hypothetical protein
MPRMLVIGWELLGRSCSCTTRMLGAALALEKQKAQVLGSVGSRHGMCAGRGCPRGQSLNRNRFVVCSGCYRVTDATTDAMCIRDVVYATHAFFIIHLSAS